MLQNIQCVRELYKYYRTYGTIKNIIKELVFKGITIFLFRILRYFLLMVRDRVVGWFVICDNINLKNNIEEKKIRFSDNFHLNLHYSKLSDSILMTLGIFFYISFVLCLIQKTPHNLPTSSRIKLMILLNGDQTGMVAENQRVRFQHHVFLVKKCFKMSN
jgi:hypothetical protein